MSLRRPFGRQLIVSLAALFLGGCVKIYVVGHTDDWSDYMTGTGSADPLSGQGAAEIRFAKLGAACSGAFATMSRARRAAKSAATTRG